MNDKTAPLKRGSALGDLIGSAVKNLKPEERPAESLPAVIEVDPTKVRMNDLHRRSKSTMSGGAILEMVEMFKATGQATPAKGWKLAKPEADGTEYVLVYGARRRAAAEQLGIALKMELLPTAPDRGTMIRLMHSENRGRLDYLPLEDAREYRAFLDSGEYRTAEEMAVALGQDKSKVSRVLSLLTLPPEVLDLYTDPSWLPQTKGSQLASAIQADKKIRARVLEAAEDWRRAGGRGNPTPTLMKALVAKPTTATAIELKGTDGRSVGVVRGAVTGKGIFTLTFSGNAPESIRREIADILNKHYKSKL